MLNQIGVQRLSRARLLLFGLLALLLWGQCAILRLVLPNSEPKYSMHVVNVDSLVAASATGPPVLYLRLNVHNKKGQELTAVGIFDELFWGGRRCTQVKQVQRAHVDVRGHASQQVVLVLPLNAQPALSPDSVQLLRQALRQGSRRQPSLLLKLLVISYAYAPNANLTLPLPPMK